MIQTIGFSQFTDAFHHAGRYDQFGYDALRVLFDYLEQMEDETGEQMELDVIGLCCEYSVDTVEDIAANYGIQLDDKDEENSHLQDVMSYLEEHTQVCGTVAGGIVYQQF